MSRKRRIVCKTCKIINLAQKEIAKLEPWNWLKHDVLERVGKTRTKKPCLNQGKLFPKDHICGKLNPCKNCKENRMKKP